MPVPALLLRTGHALQHSLMYRIGWGICRPRPDDVFLVTYPKSGTTLMQMMLYQLTTGGGMDDIAHIDDVCPWIERELLRNGADRLEALTSPRYFKTHLLRRQLPRQGRFIYVVRDVRDVAVSAFHHARLLGKTASLEAFTEEFLRQGWGASSTWFQHLRSWWPHRHDPNVLFLSYEEIVADLAGTARRVARFCGLPLREEDLARIVERCGLGFMKRHEEKLDSRFLDARPGLPGVIRQGKAGSGRELSPLHREALETRLSELAARFGCARGEPYRELLDPDPGKCG